MPLPKLTHRQFFVVSRLLHGPARGRELRSALKAAGARQSAPAFYQFMASLEDSGLVEGWYEQQTIDGQMIRERHYRLLAEGRRAWQHYRDFYAATLAAVPSHLARA